MRHRHRGSALALSLLLFCALSTTATAMPLRGSVADADTGEPLAAARVLLPGDEDVETACDDAGAFLFADLPDRPLMLIVSHLGYEPFVKLIEPGDYAGGAIEVTLAPTFFRGEKVVVSGSRYSPEVHLSLTNITAERLARRSPEKDIPLLLEVVPGLHAVSDAGNGVGYTYLKLRGFDQRRVGVMVNGIPLNDPEDHQVYWVDLPDLASSVEDIQVQRGVTNSLGGMSAIGGTVNLVTRPLRDEAGGSASLAFGSYDTWKRSLSYETGLFGGGRFASSIRLSQVQSDGYRDRSGSEQWGAFWSGRYLTENTSTTANVYTGHEVSHFAWEAIPESMLATDRTWNPDTYANAIDDFRQPHYELHHRWNLTGNLVLKNSAYYILGEGYYENFKEDRDPADFGLDTALGLADPVDLVRRKTVNKDQLGLVSRLHVDHARGHLIVGGDLYDFHSRHHGSLQMVEGVLPAALLTVPDYYAYTGDKTAWSLYANEEFDLGAGFTAMADLHYQHKTYDFLQEKTGNFAGGDRHGYTVDYDFFNPKGGLFWSPEGGLAGGEFGLYGHVGVAHREPTDGELFDTWDGPDDLGARPLFGESTNVMAGGAVDYVKWSDPLVEEERVVNYELGLSWRGERLSFALNAYRMEFENEIVPAGGVTDEGAPVRGNADKTLHRGVELGLTARLHGRHTLRLAASKSWDEYAALTVNDWTEGEVILDGNPIALFPEYLFNASLEGDYGDASAFVRARGAGKQYLDNTGDVRRTIDAYVTIDVGGSVGLAALGLKELANVTVNARVNNAFDTEYETGGWHDAWYGDGGENFYIPAAKRHFLLGVGYEF